MASFVISAFTVWLPNEIATMPLTAPFLTTLMVPEIWLTVSLKTWENEERKNV